jgi:hypothetical protein
MPAASHNQPGPAYGTFFDLFELCSTEPLARYRSSTPPPLVKAVSTLGDSTQPLPGLCHASSIGTYAINTHRSSWEHKYVAMIDDPVVSITDPQTDFHSQRQEDGAQSLSVETNK